MCTRWHLWLIGLALVTACDDDGGTGGGGGAIVDATGADGAGGAGGATDMAPEIDATPDATQADATPRDAAPDAAPDQGIIPPDGGGCADGDERDCDFDGCTGVTTCLDGVWSACVGRPEVCDGADNDCDGSADETFIDLGEPCAAGMGTCATEGRWGCTGDGGIACDARPREAAPEVCDGFDNDCDGASDEGHVAEACQRGAGACQTEGMTACVDGAVSCDAPFREPSPERCDGIDNDCNGVVDDLPELPPAPCRAGVGACQADGGLQCVGGELVCDAVLGVPADEVCNAVDDDCDGTTDEDRPDTPCAAGVGACAAEGEIRCVQGEEVCNARPLPADIERCNRVDDDCDGSVDEIGPVLCQAGQGVCRAEGESRCVDGAMICDAVANERREEQCDGTDRDCNGLVDDIPEVRCYGGPARTAGIGRCRAGLTACDADGPTCAGEVRPAEEACNDEDDDCDGRVDEQGVCAVCGDGRITGDEDCDDANLDNGDGCDALCTFEAVQIVRGRATPGAGFARGASDSFTFTVDGPSQLVAFTRGAEGGCPGDTLLDLYGPGPNGDELLLVSDDDGGLEVCSRVARALGPGAYRLRARGFGGRAVPAYTLDLLLYQDASAGGDFPGAVARDGSDLFRLDLPDPELITAFTGDGAEGCPPGDSLLALLDANFQPVVSDDDGGVGRCSRVEQRVPAGTWYLQVAGLGGAPLPGYTLTAELGVQPFCGDGAQNRPDEECDDGNLGNGDGCSENCFVEQEDGGELLLCGQSARPVAGFVRPEDAMRLRQGCAPGPDTRTMLVSRTGVIDGDAFRAFLEGGGSILTEYGNSHAVYSAIFPGQPVEQGARNGACVDNINPVVRFNEADPFWQANGDLPRQRPEQSGCGFDVGEFPDIVALGGPGVGVVSLAYVPVGLGRLWLVDRDWQDDDDDDGAWNAASQRLMRHMILRRNLPAQCLEFREFDPAQPRRIDNVSQAPVICDQNGFEPGWYRFTGVHGDQMPEMAPPIRRCGTHAPGWLAGPHPAVGDGIIDRRVCFHWNNNPCNWEAQIQVLNCGDYFLYNLVRTPVCSLRYCGEPAP